MPIPAPVRGGMNSTTQGLVFVPLSKISTQKSHPRLSGDTLRGCPEPGQELDLVILVSPFHLRTSVADSQHSQGLMT